jgi:hypothetical protein
VRRRPHQVRLEPCPFDFIEAVGTPTQDLRVPSAGEYDLSREALIRIGAEHDLAIVGPPLAASEAADLPGRKDGYEN